MDIRDCGARAGLDSTAAIQRALDRCAGTGGTVVVPAGLWIIGQIRIGSSTNLHLEAGALLRGSADPVSYPHWFPHDLKTKRPFGRRLVLAVDAADVSISGAGTIDGNHGCAGSFGSTGESNPLGLQFIRCRGVKVGGVQLRNAGSWMQQYLCCGHVRIQGISVWNHGNDTNDGLDIDGCSDVVVSDCDIDSRDDALVFKSTSTAPCEDVLVHDCRLRSTCHGIKFGTESVGGFRNVRIVDCYVGCSKERRPIPGYPEGRPVITGCALECTDGGVMERIVIRGLTVDGAFVPVFIKLGNRHHTGSSVPAGTGALRMVDIADVTATGAGPFGGSITGYPGNPVRGIRLRNCRIQHCGGVTSAQVASVVPDASDRYPEITMFGSTVEGNHLPAYGWFVRDADGVHLEDVAFELVEEDARVPVFTTRCDTVTWQNLRAGVLRDSACVAQHT